MCRFPLLHHGHHRVLHPHALRRRAPPHRGPRRDGLRPHERRNLVDLNCQSVRQGPRGTHLPTLD